MAGSVSTVTEFLVQPPRARALSSRLSELGVPKADCCFYLLSLLLFNIELDVLARAIEQEKKKNRNN